MFYNFALRVEFFKRFFKGSNKKIDIFVSHDWPAGITDYGDRDRLLRIKPHFTSDLEKNALGNPVI